MVKKDGTKTPSESKGMQRPALRTTEKNPKGIGWNVFSCSQKKHKGQVLQEQNRRKNKEAKEWGRGRGRGWGGEGLVGPGGASVY